MQNCLAVGVICRTEVLKPSVVAPTWNPEAGKPEAEEPHISWKSGLHSESKATERKLSFWDLPTSRAECWRFDKQQQQTKAKNLLENLLDAGRSTTGGFAQIVSPLLEFRRFSYIVQCHKASSNVVSLGLQISSSITTHHMAFIHELLSQWQSLMRIHI